MDLKSLDFEDRLCDTVYLGGGTPSSLSEAQLTRLMKTLSQHFRISDTAEITMEMNPCDMSEDYLKNAMRAGVNRISIGVQEKHDHLLSAIGRRHTAKEAETAVKRAYRMGFHNLSLDLMYELPGQTVKDFEASLRWAVHLPVNHMSIYSLILEDGTRMAQLAERGQLARPGEEESWAMYQAMCRILPGYGFERYEISSFARKGCRSRHNQNTGSFLTTSALAPPPAPASDAHARRTPPACASTKKNSSPAIRRSRKWKRSLLLTKWKNTASSTFA